MTLQTFTEELESHLSKFAETEGGIRSREMYEAGAHWAHRWTLTSPLVVAMAKALAGEEFVRERGCDLSPGEHADAKRYCEEDTRNALAAYRAAVKAGGGA